MDRAKTTKAGACLPRFCRVIDSCKKGAFPGAVVRQGRIEPSESKALHSVRPRPSTRRYQRDMATAAGRKNLPVGCSMLLGKGKRSLIQAGDSERRVINEDSADIIWIFYRPKT